MTQPRYTPYDGSSAPFTIGLKAIEPDGWIETDGELAAYLAEKHRLLAFDRETVFQALEGSEPSQREALDLVATHLAACHGETYRRDGNALSFLDRKVELDGSDPPLLTAGALVADDLVVLENRDGGWRVTAGFVAFPSSWSLKEKAGRTIGEIHAPVPDFEAGTRNDDLINRMFDKLQPGRLVERFNWSIYPDRELFWPPERAAEAAARPFAPQENFLRVERQTLCRLPQTGAILFTIRIYHDALAAVATRPELADRLAAQLEAMSSTQLAYKGMAEKRGRLLSYLRAG